MDNCTTAYRSHNCGELRMAQAGQTVTLAGFLENFREVGRSEEHTSELQSQR